MSRIMFDHDSGDGELDKLIYKLNHHIYYVLFSKVTTKIL